MNLSIPGEIKIAMSDSLTLKYILWLEAQVQAPLAERGRAIAIATSRARQNDQRKDG